MFCGECGTENPDRNQFCKNCGKPLKKTQVPAGQNPQAVSPPPPPAVKGSSTAGKILGILSFLCGIISWLAFPYIIGILAVFLGVVGFVKNPEKKSLFTLLCILGIVIAFASIFVDIFYLTLFPPSHEILN
jgi:hypothetical protein